MEETPRDRLAFLDRVYVFRHSWEWDNILVPMIRNVQSEAVTILSKKESEKEDPNRTKIRCFDEFLIEFDNLEIEQKELESDLKSDSEKEES